MKVSPKAILDSIGVIPSKALGQNFLQDQNIVEKIVRLANLNPNSSVVEVGPGLGILTKELAKNSKSVVAIEKDKRLYSYLDSMDFGANVKFVLGDALKLNIRDVVVSNLIDEVRYIDDDWSLVANLPYNVATPLVLEVLRKTTFIKKLVVMLQAEVADRFLAETQSKSYGAVTVKLNYLSSVTKLMKVSPKVFFPAPKVTSTVVEIVRKKVGNSDAKFNEWLFTIIDEAFKTRRKMLRNSLMDYVTQENFELAQIVPSLRAESLTCEDFIRLATVSQPKIKV